MEIFTPATPDQGLTALVYIGSAILGTLLFLKGMYAVAFLTAIGATNLARVWLELLRADYRGRPVCGLPGDGSDFGCLLFEYCAAGFRKHSPVATQLVCRISCDLDAGSLSLHRRFGDCRLSLHGSKLGHRIPCLVLRAAPQNLGGLDRGTVRVPNSRSKYGEAHSSVLSIKGGKRPSSCRGKRMFTKMSQYRLGVLACAFVVSLVARAQDVSFYEPGHVRSEYPAGQNLRNGIASGDLNNDGHPDVVVTTYNGVSVLLASPDGSSFLPALSYPVGFNTPVYVAIGDVN